MARNLNPHGVLHTLPDALVITACHHDSTNGESHNALARIIISRCRLRRLRSWPFGGLHYLKILGRCDMDVLIGN